MRLQALGAVDRSALGTHGLSAGDAGGRLLHVNRRCLDMLDLPAFLIAPGRHYLEVARFAAAWGDDGSGALRGQAGWQEQGGARRGHGDGEDDRLTERRGPSCSAILAACAP
jgi:hypothetical protein